MENLGVENLVVLNNGQAVVSSRDVAINFEKFHKHVLRDIDTLREGVQNWANLFYETTYIHNQNKQEYREILINRDGFTLLAMGFTGNKALEWKLKYIEAFNKMEKELYKPKTLSAMETLRLQFEVLDEHGTRLDYLENNMNVDFGQQLKLQNKAKEMALMTLGGTDSIAYKNRSVSSMVFATIWRDYKDYIGVGSYRDTPRVQLDKALEYLDGWSVNGKLLRQIENMNNQISL